MIPFIRKYIFAGGKKNAFAPHIFLILLVYATLVSVYTGLFFDATTTVARSLISICVVLSYTILERSRLSSDMMAFLSPTLLIGLLIGGAIGFGGDFLLFTYATGVAMISLSYMRPKRLLAYIAVSSAMLLGGMFVTGHDLLGEHFSVVYEYLFLVVATALNFLIYLFCRSYAQTLLDLTEARNEAFHASLAKGAFLSNMSHEIRTPMNAIIGMTEIGKNADDVEQAHYALGKIEDASRHLLDIINNILDVSKIESGRFDLSLMEFRFDKMLRGVINVISFRMEEKKQNFNVSIDDKIPALLIGDDQRLAQVITNLLGNAAKFTPDGGSVRFSTHLVRVEDDIVTIQFDVVDSGIGLSLEQKESLFQSFQQADASIARRFGGTGLGLSIAKSLVEMMGGRIWVESELGMGATFSFIVQLQKSASQELDFFLDEANWDAVSTIASCETADSAKADYSGKCVLLAEDLEINREIVMSFLEPTNITMICAENGAAAVRLFSKAPDKFDMVLMDVQMPEMDGYEATRCIRALDAENAKTIPIIAMTANVFREDIEQCLAAGMNDHVGKPLDVDTVMATLKKYLG